MNEDTCTAIKSKSPTWKVYMVANKIPKAVNAEKGIDTSSLDLRDITRNTCGTHDTQSIIPANIIMTLKISNDGILHVNGCVSLND